MTRRTTLAIASLLTIVIASRTAVAQQASLAAGAAVPVGDLSRAAGNGYDVQFQARTEPILGPLSLRLEIGYDFLAGKGPNERTTLSAQSIGFAGDLGSHFYWVAGPGYYQSTVKTTISGHPINEQRSYLGADVVLGANFRVFRWDGFLEVSGAKMFSPGPSMMYVPMRFGIRL